jgi:site-specific recombinase XerD
VSAASRGYACSKIAAEFRCYLLQELGRSPSTATNYVPFIDQFLMERYQDRTPNLALLRASDVTGFVIRHVHQLRPVRAGIMVTALRSFFRYLLHRGAIATDLAGCVPAVPNWSLSTLPRFLPAAVVEKLLKRCDRKTAVGRRNHAILLLLARLGVRAGEVIKLSLDDIDWDLGQITIHGKDGRSAQLPLPADVGTAVGAYLRRDRPPSASRRVFLRHRAPLTGFANPSTLSSIVRSALKHAGIESAHMGAHVLRHSLATNLLRQGGSLDEIGELLRHQSPNTTAIYAKVDVTGLTYLGVAVAGRWSMKRLRKAVHDYLTMRRGLGFKMARHEVCLLDFVAFLERKRSPHITVKLALEWQRNIRTTHLVSGLRDLPSCAASPGTGARPTP